MWHIEENDAFFWRAPPFNVMKRPFFYFFLVFYVELNEYKSAQWKFWAILLGSCTTMPFCRPKCCACLAHMLQDTTPHDTSRLRLARAHIKWKPICNTSLGKSHFRPRLILLLPPFHWFGAAFGSMTEQRRCALSPFVSLQPKVCQRQKTRLHTAQS